MVARPNNDIVLKAFLRAFVPELATGSLVAARLPADRTVWAASGFVTFLSVGGVYRPELVQRRPVYTLSVWANAGDSARPPWGKANELAEAIREVADNRKGGNVRPVGPNTHGRFIVSNFVVLNEPRKITGDESAYARFDLDVELWWSPTL